MIKLILIVGVVALLVLAVGVALGRRGPRITHIDHVRRDDEDAR